MSKNYRLIIVDDDCSARLKLREALDWQSLNIEIVAECSDGEQALTAIKQHKPDLVISEIRIPVTDGLRLAKKLAEDCFDGAVIFYSGYSDFEYARKALEYGVFAYVLKDEEIGLLTVKIKNALNSLEKKRKRDNILAGYEISDAYVKEMYFIKLINGVDDGFVRAQLALRGERIPVKGTVVFCKVIQNKGELFDNIYLSLEGFLKVYSVIGYEWSDSFVIISGLKDVSGIKAFVTDLLKEQKTEDKCRISVGISDIFGEQCSLAEAALQAKRRASQFIFSDTHNVCGGAVGEAEKPRKKIVDDALNLIRQNYAQKISVKWAASRLYVSESHLMHELKSELNKTFTDCLRDYRITKAKQLLLERKMRISEVAEAVGFADVRYFNRVFKEVTGCSPREYTENN